MNMLEIRKHTDYSPGLDTWYYTLRWEDIQEFSGMLDYVNRTVTITIDGNTHTVLVVDRPLSIKH